MSALFNRQDVYPDASDHSYSISISATSECIYFLN